MIRAIKNFFDSRINLSAETAAADRDHALRLATAALLVEVMRADFDTSADERQAVERLLVERFELSAESATELLDLAEQEVDEAVSLFQFTDLIDKTFDHGQKKRILIMLWEVVYADGHKDKHEEYLLRKIADLLHLSHKDFTHARHLVEKKRPT